MPACLAPWRKLASLPLTGGRRCHGSTQSTCGGGTLIDVPKSVRAAFADLKPDLITKAEDSCNSPLCSEIAWMKLSCIDALVLDSTRSPGNSQAQSVSRRIRQARDQERGSLWREVTEGVTEQQRLSRGPPRRLRPPWRPVSRIWRGPGRLGGPRGPSS